MKRIPAFWISSNKLIMERFCLFPSDRNSKKIIVLKAGENIIGRGFACRIQYPFSITEFDFHNNRSLQCSRKQAIVFINPSSKKVSMITTIMKEKRIIGTYTHFLYIILCRVTAMGATPLFIKSPAIDKDFRILKKGEQSPLYIGSHLCLYHICVYYDKDTLTLNQEFKSILFNKFTVLSHQHHPNILLPLHPKYHLI